VIFLKIGGSVITDKSKPFTVNWTGINTAVQGVKEIDDALIVGHGGGSFGHFVAKEYEGMPQAFTKIREAMAKLNQIFVASLIAKGVNAVGFPPSGFMISKGGKLQKTFHEPIQEAAKNHVPVVHGDAILDRERGYVIFSTERVFFELAKFIKPRRILLAGDGPVFSEGEVVKEIADWNFKDIVEQAKAPNHVDVTGGIKGKIIEAARISAKHNAEVYIFDGSVPGAIKRAWKFGEGTRVRVTRVPSV
jgi:isopentenyl phosphate kinase